MSVPREGQASGLGSRCDDERIGDVRVAGVTLETERAVGEVDGGDDIVHHLGADILRLLSHLLHEPGSLNGFGEARIVLDIRGDGELAACLQAGYEERL